MVIVEPEERVVRHYRRTSWLSSVPLLAFVVIAYVAFAAGGADFTLTRFTVPCRPARCGTSRSAT